MDLGKTAKKPAGEPAENARFLQEIEALGKALYVHRTSSSSAATHRSSSDGRHRPQLPPPRSSNSGDKSKKPAAAASSSSSSSIWNWRPLRALSSHIRNRRFNCCFTLHAHSVEGLPLEFDDLALQVHWRRRDGGRVTRPARVFMGVAEFEETLSHSCAVYGSRSGPHHSAKYEAKLFLLYVAVVGAPEVDLGRHRVDLTRLLPITLEELEDEKSAGKWTTSFRLSGKAEGAVLNVSFSFVVVGDGKKGFESANSAQGRTRGGAGDRVGGAEAVRRVGSAARAPGGRAGHIVSRSVDDVKILHEVLPATKSDVTRSMGFADLHEVLPTSKSDVANLIKYVDFDHVPEPLALPEGELTPALDCQLEDQKEDCENGCEDAEFTVIEQGVEMDEKDSAKAEDNLNAEDTIMETGKLDEIDKPEEMMVQEEVNNDQVIDEKDSAKAEDNLNAKDRIMETGKLDDIGKSEEMVVQEEVNNDQVIDEINFQFEKENVMKELESALQSLSVLEDDELDSPPSLRVDVNYEEAKSNYKKEKAGKSLSLDDVTESVASEFLDMLGIEHSPFGLSSDSDPESPRERLLKQFEKESVAAGGALFGLDIGEDIEQEGIGDSPVHFDIGESLEHFELSSFLHAGEAEHHRADQETTSKMRAKMLEDLETEALMREWGLNEKAFRSSPPDSAGGFGSPINLPPEDPLEPPPLAEGLGPFLQTKDGGFLKSMSPSLFKNSKNNGSLIMQVSSPVVVPAEMGSGVMEILQGLASAGIEKLSMQANKLMPLEDITGKSLQQVAWEAVPSLEASEREDSVHQLKSDGMSTDYAHAAPTGRKRSSRSSKIDLSSYGRDPDSEYVSLEELAPLAMDKIEALSIEGLRIQSGMSDEEAPSNITAQSFGDISALEGIRGKSGGSLGLEGAAGLQLLDIKDGTEDVDGLMGLSLSLDEWMKLDAGMVDEDERDDGRTSKILAAHHANCTTKDLISGRWKGEKKGGKGKKCGLLGNNFTVALMVQLRDPLRNHEPVGTPMLALIQVERVFVPPKPRIYYTVSDRIKNEEVDDESEQAIEVKVEEKKEEPEAELIPQFKITEVHVAGIKAEPTKKKLWGTSTQQQSGSRWLLASGMGKSNKHPLMKSKAVTKSPQATTTTVQPGETLWSISSRVHGTGAKWKDLAALNPHIRNPNVIFPNQTIRLK